MVFTKLVHKLLHKWSQAEGNSVTATEEIWKALLVKIKDAYGVFLFIKLERSPSIQIEGELTSLESNIYSAINDEIVDGWTLFGGKHLESIEYLLPDELYTRMTI